MRFLISVIFLSVNFLFAQQDNLIKYTPNYKFEEGIYVSFNAVKNNLPIPKSTLVTSIPLNDIMFFDKLFKQEQIHFYDENGVKQTIDINTIWGYSKNNILYINFENNFYRLPTIGKISQFIAKIKVLRQTSPSMYNSYYYPEMGMRTYEDTETRHFLLSFENGIIYQNNYKNVEKLLVSDTLIYNEYMSLKKRKRRKFSYIYIRKFNDNNDLFFPKK